MRKFKEGEKVTRKDGTTAIVLGEAVSSETGEVLMVWRNPLEGGLHTAEPLAQFEAEVIDNPFKEPPMLILIGESASGKSTTQKLLEKKGIRKVVTYTTRPPRSGEKDGVDYHFISEKKFTEMITVGAFAEYASYRDWFYGTALADCGYANTCAALTPAGMRALKAKGTPSLTIYIKVDRRSRLIKLLERGDDIDEACRRSLSDVGQFDAVDREADIVIHNEEYKASAENIAEFIEKVYRNSAG